MGIKIHYGDKEQFYDFTPIPYENGASGAGLPIKVSELPELTEEIVGKIYYNTTNGVYLIGKQYPEPTIGDRIYFDTTKNPADYIEPTETETPLLAISEQNMLMAMAMPVGDEGQHICYIIAGMFTGELSTPYVYCDAITVEQFNEILVPELGLPISITEFGWQTDSISLGGCANYPLKEIAVNNLADYGDIAYLKTSNFGFNDLDKASAFISGDITEITSNTHALRDEALYWRANLKSANFPDVTSIGDWAFYNCGALAEITLGATPPTLGENVFASCEALTSIYVPAESVDAYKAAEGWSAYADKIKPIPQE